MRIFHLLTLKALFGCISLNLTEQTKAPLYVCIDATNQCVAAPLAAIPEPGPAPRLTQEEVLWVISYSFFSLSIILIVADICFLQTGLFVSGDCILWLWWESFLSINERKKPCNSTPWGQFLKGSFLHRASHFQLTQICSLVYQSISQFPVHMCLSRM